MALSKNASRTQYTIKMKLKLGNEFLKRKVFSCLLKDGSELAEVTTGGRLFNRTVIKQICYVITGKLNPPGNIVIS